MVKIDYAPKTSMPVHVLLSKKDLGEYFPFNTTKRCYVCEMSDKRYQVFTCAVGTFEQPCDDYFHKVFTKEELHEAFDEVTIA